MIILLLMIVKNVVKHFLRTSGTIESNQKNFQRTCQKQIHLSILEVQVQLRQLLPKINFQDQFWIPKTKPNLPGLSLAPSG